MSALSLMHEGRWSNAGRRMVAAAVIRLCPDCGDTAVKHLGRFFGTTLLNTEKQYR